MSTDLLYALGWLVGSLAGYALSRIVWRKALSSEITLEDSVMITAVSLILSWFLVAGSLGSLLIFYLFSGIDDTQAYWFGKKGQELVEEEERQKSKGL